MSIDEKKEELRDKINTAIWIGKSLFDRGFVTGSSANMSFRHEDKIYITGSGTCFGRLTPESFSCISMDGTITGIKPSKEFPIHLSLYKNNNNMAVIHTHSMYCTMWSCLKDIEKDIDQLFYYTPYLRILTNKIIIIPFAPPGTEVLFSLFEDRVEDEGVYLLMNHGPVVTSTNLMEAFYLIEEFETSAKIAWLLRNSRKGVNAFLSKITKP